MKGISYYKHDASLRRDPKLLALAEAAGISETLAYYRYATLLEILCEHDDCLLPSRYAAVICRKEWGCKQAEAQETLEAMVSAGLLSYADDNYYSKGLLKRAEVVLVKRQQASRGGYAKAEAVANATPNAIANATANGIANATTYALAREDKSREDKRTNTPPTPPRGEVGPAVAHAEVQEFLALYPRASVSNENAVFRQWQLVRKQVSKETLLEGARRYADHVQAANTTKQHVKLAHNWLREEGWTETYDSGPTEADYLEAMEG